MQMSCLPVSLYRDLSAGRVTLGDWFGLAAELGLDGADISVVHLAEDSSAYLADVRAQAAARGLCIAMLVTYSDFTQADAAGRRRQVEMLRRHIAMAAELGAGFLRVTAGQAHPGVGRAEGIAWAVEGLSICAEEARAANVTLAYENHTRGYGWAHNDFSQPAEIFLDIVRQTEGSGLRVLYDTANTLAHGDDPLTVLRDVLPRIAVVHVNDIRRAGFFEPVVAGSGVAPIAAICRVLVEAGFDGWISVEEASNQGEAGFRQAIPFTERAWLEAGGAPRPRRSRT